MVFSLDPVEGGMADRAGGGNDAPHDGIRMKEKCQFCFRFDRQQQIIPDIKREGFYGAHEARSAIPHCCCGRCRCRCHCQLSRDSRCPRTQWSITVFSSRLITLRYCYSYDTLSIPTRKRYSRANETALDFLVIATRLLFGSVYRRLIFSVC